MKIINFTAKYILPKLLNKEKCQTIRSAFKIVDGKLIPKPSRLKVGDKVKHLWHQRSTYDEFCSVCGNSIKKPPGRAIYCDTEICPEFGRATNTFNKILGTGTITEVFEIEMGLTYISQKKIGFGTACWQKTMTEDLAKRDGFNSTEEFFNWFRNYYNLIKEKPFWVYRWKWD